VLVSPRSVEALRQAPRMDPLGTPCPDHALEVVFEEPIPSDLVRARLPGQVETTGAIYGGIIYRSPLGLPMLIPSFSAPGLPLAAGKMETLVPESVEGDFPDIAWIWFAFLRAYCDRRTAWVDPLPRRDRQARQARRHGISLGRLVLSDDATATWKRRHLAEREERERVEREASERHVAPHLVREHLCRVWILEPALGEEILDERLHRPAADGKPDVWVYCVSRSRREHVHGRGEARGRVERVVPCL
jgi:hypothetical protein